MTPLEAISARHSVRSYLHKPLEPKKVKALQAKIDDINATGRLHIQLIQDEPRAFKGIFAYGSFHGVENYLVVAGPKDDTLKERAGFYGEQLVLLAQSLGLNTCWVGLSYSKIPNTYALEPGEKIVCYIAIGYGATQGSSHKIKTPQQVSNVSSSTPDWFARAVDAALLAPTAINQQKFYFEYVEGNKVRARRLPSLVGYTHIDLGIAKLHFEIAAYPEPISWV